jgi:hypothetical protein
MDGPVRCSSLTIKCKEHIITYMVEIALLNNPFRKKTSAEALW